MGFLAKHHLQLLILQIIKLPAFRSIHELIHILQIVDVARSSVTATPTKVEVSMKKMEPGSWAKLEIPRDAPKPATPATNSVSNLSEQVESVDLSDL